MPPSSRALALFLAASTLSHQNVSAAICEGERDMMNVNMSCNSMVNTCTSSGLCVVATDGTCCAVFTGEAKSNCIPETLAGLTYITECVNDGDTMGVSGGADGQMGGGGMSGGAEAPMTCAGMMDNDNFGMSCNGLVGMCMDDGLCMVDTSGNCCTAFTDEEDSAATCDPMRPPEGSEYLLGLYDLECVGMGGGDGQMGGGAGSGAPVMDCSGPCKQAAFCFTTACAGFNPGTLQWEGGFEACNTVENGGSALDCAACYQAECPQVPIMANGGDGTGGNVDGGDPQEAPMECPVDCENTLICDCFNSEFTSQADCMGLVVDACDNGSIETCLATEIAQITCPLMTCMFEAEDDVAKLAACQGPGEGTGEGAGDPCAACAAAGACFSPDGCAAMDTETMQWGEGPFADAGCNNGADQCAICFPPCGGGDGTVDDNGTSGDGEDDMMECLDGCDSTICDCLRRHIAHC